MDFDYEQEERQMHYEFNKERIDKQFYIDRTGKVRKYKGDMYAEIVSFHYEIVSALYPDMENPDDYVMNQGWVLVGSSCYHQPIIHKDPTNAQIRTLHRLNLLERTAKRTADGKYYKNINI